MTEYDNLRRLGGRFPKSPIDRFNEGYVADPNSGCWLWLGTPRGSNGYGALKVDGKLMPAHRFSWIANIGTIPDGLFVLHKCDVPACVNPHHLFIGSGQDNSDDKVRKGRQSKGAKHAQAIAPNRARGSRAGNSKLSEADVLKIRDDDRSGRKIAADYGVTQTLIHNIKTRKTWRHI